MAENKVKILHLNTHDTLGGAARAAFRLVQALRRTGIDCCLMVQNQTSDVVFVQNRRSKLARQMASIRPYVDRLPLWFYSGRTDSPYHSQWCPEKVYQLASGTQADLIHLHWICAGFLQIETLSRIHKPMVWTLHDMWPFTGGCHFSGICSRYTERCGFCPKLSSHRDYDLSRWVIRRKEKSWQHTNLTIVSPSRWLAERARDSRLFRRRRIVVIPNCIDTERFKPIDKPVARDILDLPQDKKIILFSAMGLTSDPRKGFSLLLGALDEFRKNWPGQDIEIVLVGQSEPREPPKLAFPTRYLGRLHDDVTLALSYASADLFLAPSTEDNLPNTVMEALACGTPCVAFKIGGMPDLIDHQINGFLAVPFETGDLAAGMRWVLADAERNRKLGGEARKKVMKTFDTPVVAAQYAALYKELVGCG